jgi:hypothetical protein
MAQSLCEIGCRLNGWNLIVIVAEGCSPSVLSALAVCRLGAYAQMKLWWETVLRKHSCAVGCNVIRST